MYMKEINDKVDNFAKNSNGEDWEKIGLTFRKWENYILKKVAENKGIEVNDELKKDLKTIQEELNNNIEITSEELEENDIAKEIKIGDDITLTFEDYVSMVKNGFLEFDHNRTSIDSYYPFISTESGLCNYINLISNINNSVDYHYIYTQDTEDYYNLENFNIKNLTSNLNKNKPQFVIINNKNEHAIFYICIDGKIFEFDTLELDKSYRQNIEDVNFSLNLAMQNDKTSCRSIALYFLEHFYEVYKNKDSNEEFVKELENIFLFANEQSKGLKYKSDILNIEESFFNISQSVSNQNVIVKNLVIQSNNLKTSKEELKKVSERINQIDKKIKKIFITKKEKQTLKNEKNNLIIRKNKLEYMEKNLERDIKRFSEIKEANQKELKLFPEAKINPRKKIINISSLSNRLKQLLVLNYALKNNLTISENSFKENVKDNYKVVSFYNDKDMEIFNSIKEAIEKNDLEKIKEIFENNNNINMNIKNGDDKTILDIANEKNNKDIIIYLREEKIKQIECLFEKQIKKQTDKKTKEYKESCKRYKKFVKLKKNFEKNINIKNKDVKSLEKNEKIFNSMLKIEESFNKILELDDELKL